MSATRIVGPSLAGLIIAIAGPAACFGFLAVAYLAPIAALLLVIPDIAPPRDENRRGVLRDMVAGLVTAARVPLLRATLIVGGTLALLGVSYMPYLPVLAISRLHASAQVLGLMYSVGGVGGLIGGLVLGTMRSARRRQLLGIGGVLYAISLFTVAQSTTLLITLPALVGISFGFVAINTSLTTLLQTEAPPAMRGRLLGLYATVFAGSMPLGTLLYGALAGAVGLFNAIAVGALVVGGTALVVSLTGALRSADPVPDEPPAPAATADLTG
jgi:MFS family permease